MDCAAAVRLHEHRQQTRAARAAEARCGIGSRQPSTRGPASDEGGEDPAPALGRDRPDRRASAHPPWRAAGAGPRLWEWCRRLGRPDAMAGPDGSWPERVRQAAALLDRLQRQWIREVVQQHAAARNASDSLDDSRDARLATLTLPAYEVHTGFLFSTKAAIPSRPSGATALHEIASAMISYALSWVNSICL